MRFCNLRKKKGGSKGEFQFEKPNAKFSSSGQALENYNKQQDIQNKADAAALQNGGNKDEITVPTMGDNPEGNASIRTAVSGLAKSDADGEFDTPPKLEGGRRTKRKRKRKKGRRLTKICVKKCTRKCYTPKRGGKRRKSRRKKNQKKRTRRRGGVRSPSKKTPTKKKQPIKKQPISPPRKPVNWEKHKPKLKKIIETYATTEQTNPGDLLFKRRGAPRHVPTTPRAKHKAEFLNMRKKLQESAKVFQTPKRGGKRRKTRKRMRKRKRKKTRK